MRCFHLLSIFLVCIRGIAIATATTSTSLSHASEEALSLDAATTNDRRSSALVRREDVTFDPTEKKMHEKRRIKNESTPAAISPPSAVAVANNNSTTQEEKDGNNNNITLQSSSIPTSTNNSSSSLSPTLSHVPSPAPTSPAPLNATNSTNAPSLLSSTTSAPSPNPTSPPSTMATTKAATPSPTYSTLPLQHINIVVLTDVHSWVQGHGKHESPKSNADFGHVLSFYQRLTAIVAEFDLDENNNANGEKNNNNKNSNASRRPDLYFVMNGDFVHGTFLGADPPTYLSGIIEKMPYDVVTIGNHDINNEDTLNVLRQPGGLIDSWGEKLVTSNVRVVETGGSSSVGDVEEDGDGNSVVPLGSKYRFLHGNQGSILTFGFLYNDADGEAVITVETVQDTIQQSWFQSLFASPRPTHFDAILVLAHMDVQDELISFLHSELRKLCGETMVIQFITGHTHNRSYVDLDSHSSSLEAGRYLDTVGFVSFHPLQGKFQHVFIDANEESLSQSLGMDVEEYPTEDGKELSLYIERTLEHAGANEILGCAPRRYRIEGYLNETDSLLQLYLGEVMPSSFLQVYNHGTGSSSSFNHYENAFIQYLEWFVRYDLFSGVVTMNDIYAVIPEDDSIAKLSHSMFGGDIIKIWEAWNDERLFLDNTTYVVGVATENPTTPQEGHVPQQPLLENDSKYALYSLSKDAAAISKIMSVLGFPTFSTETDVFHGKKTMRSMWIEYVQNEWPYDGNNCNGFTDRGSGEKVDNTGTGTTPSTNSESSSSSSHGNSHISVPSNANPPAMSGRSSSTSKSSGGSGAAGKFLIVLVVCAVVFFVLRSKRRGYTTPRDLQVSNDLELQVVTPQGYNGFGGGYSSPSVSNGRYV